MWNPVLFAIYHQKMDIAQELLTNYSHNLILSIRMPPQNDLQQYIIPNSRAAFTGMGRGLQLMDGNDWKNTEGGFPESPGNFNMSPSTYNHSSAYLYNPMDARVECFGLELAIRNRDILMLDYLWSE